MQTHPVVDVRSPEIEETNDVKNVIMTIGGRLAVAATATGERGMNDVAAVMTGPTIETKTGTRNEGENETNEKDAIVTETVKRTIETEESAGANARRTRMPWTKIAPKEREMRKTWT